MVREVLIFEKNIPKRDPTPINAVTLSKDNPIEILSNSYIVDPDRGITTITIIRLHPIKK